MELILSPVKPNRIAISNPEARGIQASTSEPFIKANTEECALQEIKDNHIIPVFLKDNEPLISHADFIDVTMQTVSEVYNRETILAPSIRVSHPMKGRIAEAKHKPASELFEHEKTLYYERMMFLIEIPSVQDEVDGNLLSLMVGGVKSYSLDNLYGRKGNDEHFKIFIGFKNTVCCNLKIWSDGLISDLKVKDIGQLRACIKSLFESFNAPYQLFHLKKLANYSLTESRFAQLIGRCKMYPYLSRELQRRITPLKLGDAQINTVVADYYKDESFCRDDKGNISLWKLYNLFTEANKSSYIDNFAERSVNVHRFTDLLRLAIQKEEKNWFIN